MLKRGLKKSTKDIDIIVDNKKEFVELRDILENKGFSPKLPSKEYSRMNLSQIFQKYDMRVDLFCKEVSFGE